MRADMSRKNKKSLVYQVQERYMSMLCPGQSKHNDKQKEQYLRTKDNLHPITKDKIYSYSTLRTYMKHANYFTKYCKTNYNCKSLDQCEKYVDEWLATRTNLSAYTQKLEVAALAKLYGKTAADFNQTSRRERQNITRSRNKTDMDKHFSFKNNKEFIDFCKSTGLRRAEITALKGSDLVRIDNKYYIHVVRGTKGGKERYTLIINHIDMVVDMMQRAGENKVFERVPTKADIHSYRSDYATTLYNQIARPVEGLSKEELYICKKDRKGDIFDKSAMLYVSKNLGHNRISVIAGHYLRD